LQKYEVALKEPLMILKIGSMNKTIGDANNNFKGMFGGQVKRHDMIIIKCEHQSVLDPKSLNC
jgi:hypothetical protein